MVEATAMIERVIVFLISSYLDYFNSPRSDIYRAGFADYSPVYSGIYSF